MHVLRIYTGDDHESHFEDLDIPLNEGPYGSISSTVRVKGVNFRETPAGATLDFHNAPQRQFVITLTGAVEIEVGDGTKRRLDAGDILLADDTTGHGHITREIEGPRRSLFLPLADEVDIGRWRK
jgi:quercetin dioxygenase-like cupin family protein